MFLLALAITDTWTSDYTLFTVIDFVLQLYAVIKGEVLHTEQYESSKEKYQSISHLQSWYLSFDNIPSHNPFSNSGGGFFVPLLTARH